MATVRSLQALRESFPYSESIGMLLWYSSMSIGMIVTTRRVLIDGLLLGAIGNVKDGSKITCTVHILVNRSYISW